MSAMSGKPTLAPRIRTQPSARATSHRPRSARCVIIDFATRVITRIGYRESLDVWVAAHQPVKGAALRHLTVSSAPNCAYADDYGNNRYPCQDHPTLRNHLNPSYAPSD